MPENVKQYGRAKLVTPTQGGGPGAITVGESSLALNPTFAKVDSGEVEVYVPYDQAAGFARFASGNAEALEAAGKLLLAAARFAGGSSTEE